jgi:hypothetical protein
MSKLEVNKIDPQTGTDLELGSSGDTITIPSGATLDASNATTSLPTTVVTTTGTQTLTNKTVAAGSNTITGLTNTNLSGSAAITNANLDNSSITLNGTAVSLGGSATISAGTDWQAVKTSNFTAVAGEGYFVDTSSAAITLTLPASPSLGDEVSFKDYANTFDTNNLTIGRNSENIEGDAADLTVAVEGSGNTLVYVDATKGWLLRNK